jgi:signal transduction histidine kinase
MQESEIQDLKSKYFQTADHLQKATIGNQLCEALFGTHSYEEALRYATEALSFAEELENNEICYSICSTMSNIYMRLGDFFSSKRYSIKSLAFAQASNNIKGLAQGYNNLGNAEFQTALYESAINYYLKSLDMCKANEITELIPGLYNNIGTVYANMGAFDLALKHFKKGLKKGPSTETKIKLLVNISNTYKLNQSYSFALGYVKKGMRISRKINDLFAIAHIHLITGDIYYLMSDYENALMHSLKAFDGAKEKGYENILISASLLRTKVLTAIKDYDGASEFYKHLIKIQDNIQSKQLLQRFYAQYCKFCAETGDYKSAYEYHIKSADLKEHILNENAKKNIEKMGAEYKYQQKEKESQLLREKNIELQEYKDIISEQNHELKNLIEEKDTIMNTISHDLKNYIGAIQMALGTAIAKFNDMSENKYIKMIDHSSSKALNLVKDMLLTKKLEVRQDTISLSPHDINRVFKDYEGDYIIKASHKNIKMVFKYHPDKLICLIDNDKWHRIIENLYSNAVKFTHPNGKITIKTQKKDNMAMVTIIDEGIGIPAESISKLFQKFSGVGRKGTAGEESTGLGLYIVKKLVDLHNGTIEVKSATGKGTKFMIKLPVVEQQSDIAV